MLTRITGLGRRSFDSLSEQDEMEQAENQPFGEFLEQYLQS